MGYTLVELTVVLLVMSLMVAISMPLFSRGIARYRLDVAAKELESEIRRLQQEALRREVAGYYILFDTYNERYFIHGPEGDRIVNMPSGVDVVSTAFTGDKLVFRAQGSPLEGGNVFMRHTGTGEVRYLFVTPITGRTRVGEENYSAD